MVLRSKKKLRCKKQKQGAELDLLSCPLSSRKTKALGAEIKLKTTHSSRVSMASLHLPMLSQLLLLLLLFRRLLLPEVLLLASASVGFPLPHQKPSDTDSLTIFRYRADAHGILAANWSTADACTGRWRGVGCSAGRVTSLFLPSIDLRGPLDALSQLDELRLIDLHGNRLSGTLVNLLPCLPKLKLLYLSGNDLSGEIPTAIGRLNRLLRLDLADNNFDGSIPGEAFSNLTRLLTLRLQNNLLSGLLPDLANALPRLVELNVSNNQLSGRLPDAVRVKFGLEAVAGNAGLCGPTPPLPLCSFIPRDSPPSISSSPSAQSVVPSNLSSVPHSPTTATIVNGAAGGEKRVRENLSTGAIIGISVANAVFFLLLLLFLAFCCCAGPLGENDGKVDAEDEQKEDYKRSSAGSYSNDEDKNSKAKAKKKKADRNSSESDDGSMRSQLVFFDQTEEEEEALLREGGGLPFRRKARNKVGGKGRRFELEELLRASAEMLGKGSIGTVYRAALEDGEMVAVKRLKDANPCARKEFHKYMDLIGRLCHPNIVRLRAYYYAKQEKLLLYQYLPNGTLFSLLHGNRGNGRVPLDWTTRVSLVLGAARGLARIHQEYSASKIPHGNIKTCNILLDKNGVAHVSDFGLALLLSPSHATARLGGYAAPEQAETRKLSQEADVYAFGVLVLEVLTGRVPNQWHGVISNGEGPVTGADGGGLGLSLSLPEWVRSVVRAEWTAEVFDVELVRYKNVEEEMVAMLHVGLACSALQPEARPPMFEVVRMIEDIRVEQSPLAEDEDELNESRIPLSPSFPTTPTEDGRQSYALTE